MKSFQDEGFAPFGFSVIRQAVLWGGGSYNYNTNGNYSDNRK